MVCEQKLRKGEDEMIAYRFGRRFDMKLKPASSSREWMNQTNSGFANRCLPMRIAGQAGWVILNNQSLRAKWAGDPSPRGVSIEYAGDGPHAAISHFGDGILTFSVPYLFRTPPGIALLFRGPANLPKDGIAALEGLVETDWAVAAASMNWKFTRPNTWVEFAADEPICMIVPQRLDILESLSPRVRNIEDNRELHQNFAAWSESCREFNERLRAWEPEAVKLGWQRYYLRGSAPHAGSEVIVGDDSHRTRLDVKEFESDEYEAV